MHLSSDRHRSDGPSAELEVLRSHDAAGLVVIGDHMEQQMSTLAIHGDIALFITDEQILLFSCLTIYAINFLFWPAAVDFERASSGRCK